MKHFNMTQRRVLCPHNHLLKTTTTIRRHPRVVQLPGEWPTFSGKIGHL